MQPILRWCLRLFIIAIILSTISKQANSQPRTDLLSTGCSQFQVTNRGNFNNNLNTTLRDLRNQISGNGSRLFATSQQARSTDPVFGMVQCRNYMSEADCVSCFDSAVTLIRNCSNANANGGRATFDGCFLRYESITFFQETSGAGNFQICSNHSASQPLTEFNASAITILRDLSRATPRVPGYWAAISRQVVNSNVTIYGVAQCVGTATRVDCRNCVNANIASIIQTCLPSAGGRAIDSNCYVRYSDFPFFASNQTTNLAPYLRESGSSRRRIAIIAGVAGGGGLLVLILVALLLWYKFTRKPEKPRRGNILGATELQGPNMYSYKDLKAATNNFSEENKLGEGGFGCVYKATLKNGNVVAVKKLDISYRKVMEDFESEVRLISNVHHRNPVRLLGCCNKGTELLLVYECMANGSLDRHLYGEKRGALSWKQRFDIIFGTARGLAYLHEQYHVCIIHRDIKPGNILLDNEFQPKIADFGLARLKPENQSHVSTKFAGTLGYTAPEYAIHGHLSEKVDTYSFGILLLEIVSGRRGNDISVESESEYLLEEAWKLYESGMHEKLVDNALNSDDYKIADLKKMVEIALVCTQSPASLRPTMSEVLVMLSSNVSIEPQAPNRPASFESLSRTLLESSSSARSGSALSSATVTYTQFSGR